MWKSILAVGIAMLMAFSVKATQFEQDKYYRVIDGAKPPSTPTVTEFFSFYCPHCYKFEAVVEQLKPNLPANATFEKVHVSFMGDDMAVPMAMAYATMVSLKVEKTMVPVMFEQIHNKRQPPRNEAELRQLFIDNGVDPVKYDAVYDSFTVNAMQMKFDKDFAGSTLTGVPAVVVNNKYIVKTDHIKSYDEYNQLVSYLLSL